MNIDDVMTKNIVTVEMDDPLSEVHTIFESTNFHHLLVVENNKLVGIVSDRDLLKSLSPNVGTLAETKKDALTLNKRVHQIMSRMPLTAEVNESIYKVIDIFNNNKISCVPIIDSSHKPVGIISWRDILKLIKQKNTGKKSK